MQKRQKGFPKVLSCMLAICLLCAAIPAALGENLQTELEGVYPLLDLVCSAAAQTDDGVSTLSPDYPMSQEMVNTLFSIGGAIPATRMDATMDAGARKQYLLANFSESTVPEPESMNPVSPEAGYTGFRPMASDAGAEEGSIQVVGEVYHAAKPYAELTAEERLNVTWDEPAVFLLKSDATAMFGYRVISFSFGSVIDLEGVMSDYFTSILVEYENNSLGFSVQYPAAFEEDMLTEDENGIAGKLPNGKASFFVKRGANSESQTLEGLKASLEQQPGVVRAEINSDFGYLTVQSVSDDGFVSNDLYIATDDFIYQSNLTYHQDVAQDYQMYTMYMENSFIVFEVSVG